MRVPFAAFLSILMIAGCTTTAPTPLEVDGQALETGFEGLADGAVPEGWSTDNGAWGAVEVNATTVIEGEGDDALNSLLADPAGDFDDFDLTVDLTVLSDEHPAGGGIVLHYVDAQNYQIIRYSLSENGWHLFTVHQGNRDKQSDGSVAGAGDLPQIGQWFELRVVSQDGHVTAYEDGELVIDYQLEDHVVQVGRVGLFIRGENGARFDDFSVAPL